MSLSLAIDIGGTKAESALVASDGTVLAGSRFRAPTGADCSPSNLAEILTRLVGQALETVPVGHVIRGVGIGTAGPINRPEGSMSPLNMPRLANFELVKAVARTVPVGTPIHFALDGTCIALAEAEFGAAQGVSDVVCMIVSTGIGGGVFSAGRIVLGAHGNAGHVGQLVIDGAGNEHGEAPRTLEAIASGPNSVAWARTRGWRGDTGEQLARDALAGAVIARGAIERSASAVGAAVASLCSILDIELAVIGGGFSFVSEDYVDLVQASARRVAELPAARNVRVVRAALGGDAPLVGAAQLLRTGLG